MSTETKKKVEYPKLTKEIVEGFATSCLTKYYDDASQFADFHRDRKSTRLNSSH